MCVHVCMYVFERLCCEMMGTFMYVYMCVYVL